MLIACCGLILLIALASSAQELNSRKGFFIGFDVGSGFLHITNRNEADFLFAFKLGGGVNEKILLMFEGGSAGAWDDDRGIFLMDFATQFFVHEGFYLRPRAGIGATYVGDTYSSDGFTGGLSAGHEWRIKKGFSLSAEGKSDYVRVSGANHYSIGAAADLRWYF